jgi:hypothetical protein
MKKLGFRPKTNATAKGKLILVRKKKPIKKITSKKKYV